MRQPWLHLDHKSRSRRRDDRRRALYSALMIFGYSNTPNNNFHDLPASEKPDQRGVEPIKRLVIDLDGTLTLADTSDYRNVSPNLPLIEKLREYKEQGFEIVIQTARNMRTHENNVGKITAHTVPIIIEWLQKHDIPYDEIFVGKPWCGHEGFYVDDRAIRPDEFVRMSKSEIDTLLDNAPKN